MRYFERSKNLLLLNGKKKFFFLFVKLQFLSIFEALGVASVMPVLSYLSEPNIAQFRVVEYMPRFIADQIVNSTPPTILITLSFLSFTVIFTSSIYRSFAIYSINTYLEQLRCKIAVSINSNILHQDLKFHLNHNSNELLKSVTSETDFLIGNIFRPVILMLSNISIIILIGTVILLTNVLVAIGTIIFLGGLYALIFLLTRNKLQKMGEELVKVNSQRFTSAKEGIANVISVQLNDNHSFFVKKHHKFATEFSQLEALFQTLHTIPKFIIEALAIGAILLVMTFVIILNESTPDDFLKEFLPLIGLYVLSAYKLQPALQSIFQGLSSLKYGDEIVTQVSKLISLNSRHIPDGAPIGDPVHVSIKDVALRATEASNILLQNVTMELSRGDCIGIFGASGQGKSTLIKFILGLIKADKGSVRVSGIQLNDFSYKPWQRIIGYVPQEVYLFDGNIRDNVAFGIDENAVDDERVERCCELAQLSDFIDSLPEKYLTLVGEGGARLSGGQKQRIGIARALYRDPSVLIFDEATSALDEQTEADLLNDIYALAENKIILMVSHRVDTLSRCSQCFEICNGNLTLLK